MRTVVRARVPEAGPAFGRVPRVAFLVRRAGRIRRDVPVELAVLDLQPPAHEHDGAAAARVAPLGPAIAAAAARRWDGGPRRPSVVGVDK